ncbi:hypothetical protein V6Z11_D11G392000 [Gossypium hirsutum]
MEVDLISKTLIKNFKGTFCRSGLSLICSFFQHVHGLILKKLLQLMILLLLIKIMIWRFEFWSMLQSNRWKICRLRISIGVN